MYLLLVCLCVCLRKRATFCKTFQIWLSHNERLQKVERYLCILIRQQIQNAARKMKNRLTKRFFLDFYILIIIPYNVAFSNTFHYNYIDYINTNFDVQKCFIYTEIFVFLGKPLKKFLR